MKAIIRFLARISGVEDDIRNETTEHIGGQLRNESHWFTGLYNGNEIDEVQPIFAALFKIGDSLEKKHRFDVSRIRDEVVEWIREGNKLEQIGRTEAYGEVSPLNAPGYTQAGTTLEELLRMQVEDVSPVTDKKVKFSPDFIISVQDVTEDGVEIIVHANGYSSETLDFCVKQNHLKPLGV